MSEWWTYHLSDFLLFSPRTYDRLIALYNAAVWPAQLVGLALGLGLVVLATRPSVGPRSARSASLILAAACLFVAIAFHARRYATINWAAVYFAWAFALQAALFVLGAAAGRPRVAPAARIPARVGFGILVFAVVGEPLLAPLTGRGWRGAEVFGVLPDPTALATLGLLLAVRFRGRWAWMAIPAIWCAISGATLLAMKSPAWWIAPLGALMAVGTAAARRA